MQHIRPASVLVALALAGSLGLAACGSDDDTPAMSGDATTSTTEEETTTTAPEAETVEVTGIDYAFEGIPTEVEASTEFTFTNGSDKEAHEMILMRVNDGETRSLDELLALPEEEAMQAVAMKGVAVAMPGEDGQVVEGELVADEPGRYVALCFIPVGADPDSMAEAMESEGPPPEDPNAGPPHFVQGMKTEFTVK